MSKYNIFLGMLILTSSCTSIVKDQDKYIVPPEIEPGCISTRPEPRNPDDSLLVGKTRLTNGCQGVVEVTGAWHKNGAFFNNGTTGTMRLDRGESVVVRVHGDGPGIYEYMIYKVVLAVSNGVACNPPSGDLGISLPARGRLVLNVPSLAPSDAQQRVCTLATGMQGKRLAEANCYSLNIAQTDLAKRSGWRCESDMVCGDGVVISKIEAVDEPTGLQLCALVKNGSSHSKRILINMRLQ